jgi:hypothetical protein
VCLVALAAAAEVTCRRRRRRGFAFRTQHPVSGRSLQGAVSQALHVRRMHACVFCVLCVRVGWLGPYAMSMAQSSALTRRALRAAWLRGCVRAQLPAPSWALPPPPPDPTKAQQIWYWLCTKLVQ